MANAKDHLEHITSRFGVSGAIVRAALWLAFVGGGFWFLSQIQFTLTVFGLAWLIAYLMNPLIELLEGRRLGPVAQCSRGLAVGGIYLCIFALLFLTASLAFPSVSSQIEHLIDLQKTLYNPHELSTAIQNQGERLVQMVPEQYRAPLMEKLRASLGTITTEAGKVISSVLSQIAGMLGSMLKGLVMFLTALLISIFFILGWSELRGDFIGFFPHRYHEEIEKLLAQMHRIFGGYIRATIVTSAAAGVSSTVCVWIYSLVTGHSCPYALIIGLIAGIAYPIPLFGILSSTVIAAVLSFFPESNSGVAVSVGLIVLLANLTIDRTIQPKLMSAAIGVSPLFVMFAAAAGGEFIGGVWGMLLGIPLAAMTKAFLTWIHDLFLVDAEEPQNHKEAPTQPPQETEE